MAATQSGAYTLEVYSIPTFQLDRQSNQYKRVETPKLVEVVPGAPETLKAIHKALSDAILYAPVKLYPPKFHDKDVDAQQVIDDIALRHLKNKERGVIPDFGYSRLRSQYSFYNHDISTLVDEDAERIEAVRESRYVVRLGDALATIMPIVRAIDGSLGKDGGRDSAFGGVYSQLWERNTHVTNYSWIMDYVGPSGNVGDSCLMYDYNGRPSSRMQEWLCEDDVLRVFSEPIAVAYLLSMHGKSIHDLFKIGQVVRIKPGHVGAAAI